MRNNEKGACMLKKGINTRKTNWLGHILRKNCCLKHNVEGTMEGR